MTTTHQDLLSKIKAKIAVNTGTVNPAPINWESEIETKLSTPADATNLYGKKSEEALANAQKVAEHDGSGGYIFKKGGDFSTEKLQAKLRARENLKTDIAELEEKEKASGKPSREVGRMKSNLKGMDTEIDEFTRGIKKSYNEAITEYDNAAKHLEREADEWLGKGGKTGKFHEEFKKQLKALKVEHTDATTGVLNKDSFETAEKALKQHQEDFLKQYETSVTNRIKELEKHGNNLETFAKDLAEEHKIDIKSGFVSKAGSDVSKVAGEAEKGLGQLGRLKEFAGNNKVLAGAIGVGAVYGLYKALGFGKDSPVGQELNGYGQAAGRGVA